MNLGGDIKAGKNSVEKLVLHHDVVHAA